MNTPSIITRNQLALAIAFVFVLALLPAVALAHGGFEHVMGTVSKISDTSVTATATPYPSRAQVLTAIDDHSRFVVCAGVMTRAVSRAVCGHFAAALGRDQPKDEFGRCHAACRSETQLAVKPGPSAVNSERAGSPLARARSRMNKTVGADMLP